MNIVFFKLVTGFVSPPPWHLVENQKYKCPSQKLLDMHFWIVQNIVLRHTIPIYTVLFQSLLLLFGLGTEVGDYVFANKYHKTNVYNYVF